MHLLFRETSLLFLSKNSINKKPALRNIGKI